MEIWRVIQDYPNYEISSFGRIRNNNTGRILKPSKVGKYLSIMLKNEKRFYMHRLVALAFIENPNNYPQVNHKDENTENNIVDNLEWCSSEYNANYGNRNKKLAEIFSKRVICLETGEIFDSAREASRKLKIHHGEIIACCNLKKRKSARGKHFCYLNNQISIDEIEKISKNKYRTKKVRCIETGEIFNSLIEASKAYKTTIYNICSVLKGKSKTAKGYHWEYC